MTDQLSFTGGIRYTLEHHPRHSGLSTRIGLVDGVETCNDIVRFNRGIGANGRLTPLPVTDPQTCSVFIEEKSGEPTWLLGVDFKPMEDLLLYGKYSRGYRSGGVNLTTIGLESWEPEFVDAYEVGAKYSFSGAVRGYFNIAGFHNKLKQAQLPVSGLSAVPGFSGAQPVINAGTAKIQGIEVDASISPFEGFKLDAGYTYLDSKLESIDDAKLNAPPGSPYLPRFVPNAVRRQLTGPVTQEPADPDRHLHPAAGREHRRDFVWRDLYPYRQAGRHPGDVQRGAFGNSRSLYSNTVAPGTDFRFAPATDLLNLNVNWNNFMGKPVDLAFFVTNLTKQVYAVDVGSSFNSAGFENQLMGPPRMWGFRLKYRFGD